MNQGYFNMEETSNLHPDQVEGWVFCRRAFQMAGGAGCNGNSADLDRFWPVCNVNTPRVLLYSKGKMVLPNRPSPSHEEATPVLCMLHAAN